MKLLFYRRGALGDTLLTFPLLEIFKREGYHITAVGNTDYFKIAEEVGWVDRVTSEVPQEKFDREVIISFEGNVSPFPNQRVWIVEHYLNALAIKDKAFSEELPLKPLPASPFEDKAVLHPSSGSPKKNPPIELFLELEDFIRSRGIDTLYIVGEADSWLKNKVRNFVESHDPLWIARALKSARLFVGLDSGISHLASYVGLKSVVIYGPTDPVVWKPVGRNVHQVSLNLECSPCFPNVCPCRDCLDTSKLLKSLFPLLDHLLIKVN